MGIDYRDCVDNPGQVIKRVKRELEESQSAITDRENDIKVLKERIDELEEAKAALEKELAKPPQDATSVAEESETAEVVVEDEEEDDWEEE